MAFRRKLVVEDRIEIVGNLIYHPFIDTFNENPPTDFLGKLVIAAEPKNKRVSVCAPKEVIEIQINRELPEKVDTARETGEPIEFIATGAETIENRQLPPGCLIIDVCSDELGIEKLTDLAKPPEPTGSEEVKSPDINVKTRLAQPFP